MKTQQESQMNTFDITSKSRSFTVVSRFLTDERGVTAIEYGLIAAATGLALAAVMPTIKSNLSTTFTAVSNNLQ